MEIGMLWFDNDKKVDLKAKVDRAAAYYQQKYGQSPNMCFVHPSMVGAAASDKIEAGKIEVRTIPSILPNHFWIGMRVQ